MVIQAQRMRPVLLEHRTRLMTMENVVGVGIGLKEEGGESTDQVAITVLVTKKVDPAKLSPQAMVPRTLGEGYPTDVVEVGHVRLLAEVDRLERARPAYPGVSVGHYKISAGTLGAIVVDNSTGERMVLSNNHVLANMTNGADGRAEVGDPILQPGAYDGGSNPQDVLGHLARFVPLHREMNPAQCPYAVRMERLANKVLHLMRPDYRVRFLKAEATENIVDAAVASLPSSDVVGTEILGIGSPSASIEPEVGMAVIKSGRTTGVTEGTIRALDVTIRVQLGDIGTGLFADQVLTTSLAQPGDSGSLVVTRDDHRVVGLLSAGSDTSTILGRWSNISSLLNIRLPEA